MKAMAPGQATATAITLQIPQEDDGLRLLARLFVRAYLADRTVLNDAAVSEEPHAPTPLR